MATLTQGLLAMDDVAISRATAATDAEGNAKQDTRTVVYDGRGTWGLPTSRDITLADSRGEVAAAALAIPSGIAVRLDDDVDVRGSRYVVVSQTDVRTGQRLVLRKVSF